MRWSDCIASKSSFWSDEVTIYVLKSMKKIGRYNRKIGRYIWKIGIGIEARKVRTSPTFGYTETVSSNWVTEGKTTISPDIVLIQVFLD